MSSAMARHEIPSIVVHNGSASDVSSPETDSRSEPVHPNNDQNVSQTRKRDDETNWAKCKDDSACASPSEACTSRASTPTSPMGGPTCALEGERRSRSLDFAQQSTDSDDYSQGTRLKTRQGNKNRFLTRSVALSDDASPPPSTMLEGCSCEATGQSAPMSGNSLTVDASTNCALRPRLHTPSRQGSSENSSIPSRCSSESGYTDSSGINMIEFLAMTFNKSRKDRTMLLEIEQELTRLVEDKSRTSHRLQPTSSYHRMLIHRCAAFFGLSHTSEQGGTGMIVSKEARTRIPPIKFIQLGAHGGDKKSILQREYSSLEDSHFKDSHSSDLYENPKLFLQNFRGIEGRRTKSLEEREEAYEKARKRIFYADPAFGGYGGIDVSRRYDDPRWRDFRPPGHTVSAHESYKRFTEHHRLKSNRSLKGESFENQDMLSVRVRPHVFKSNSFGGYNSEGFPLSRDNSINSSPSTRIHKQDSVGRYSDYSSSSGYKTQRQDTASSTNISNTLSETPSPTTINNPIVPQAGYWGNEPDAVMWAVTDMDAVPYGALLINPQTGQPYMNADGTPYRYDPSNPPNFNKLFVPSKLSQSKDTKSKSETKLDELEVIESEKRSKKSNCDTEQKDKAESVEESDSSESGQSKRHSQSSQNVREIRAQFSTLSLSTSVPDSPTEGEPQSSNQGTRHAFSHQAIYYGPSNVKSVCPASVPVEGQPVHVHGLNIGMAVAQHGSNPVTPSSEASCMHPGYIPGSVQFVSIMSNPPGPTGAHEAAPAAAPAPVYCSLPPNQAVPVHTPIGAASSNLPLQYSVPTTNASSCSLVPAYWGTLNNTQMYQQPYAGQIYASHPVQTIHTPPPIPSQTALMPAFGSVPSGSSASQYMMIHQHPHVRPPLQSNWNPSET